MTSARGNRTDPPRLAERMLEAAIQNPVARNGLIGDLREVFAKRLRTHGWLACAIWYWRQAIASTTRYGIEHISRGRRKGRLQRIGRTQSTRRERSLMTTLLHEMERRGARYGLQTMCEGGGMANGTIIELIDA